MIVNRVTPKIQSASAVRFLLLTPSLFVFIVSALLFHNEAFGAQVTLAWDPETASGLAGYKVHYGTASKNYPLVVDAGNHTTTTITGLTVGATYYFAATAYNTAGTESALSNEVAYTVPTSCSSAISPGSASPTAAGGTGSVTVTTSSTCSWTTAAPVSWVTITSGASGTGNGTVKYSVSANTGSGSRTTNWTIAGVTFTITQAGGVPTSYTITASTGANGSISPAGQVTVGQGGSQSYTITPASGHKVAAVTVDGASVGAVTSYAFSNVTNNHSISATFTAQTYTITASAATNGSISPSESVTQTPTAFTLAVARSGSGWGSVTKSPLAPSFPVGTVVTLTAAPGWSSVFSGWSGACSGTSGTCTLTMTSDASVTATFNSRWAWGLH